MPSDGPLFQTPEEYVAAVEQSIAAPDLDLAIRIAREGAEYFPTNPLALHAAGLAHERAAIDQSASTGAPPGDDIDNAAEYYAAALDHACSEGTDMHRERLFSCLFIAAARDDNPDTMGEALFHARILADAPDPALAARYARELAVASSAIARMTGKDDDWRAAALAFQDAPEPEDERELAFFHLYRGLATKRVGELDQSDDALRSAAMSFTRSLKLDPKPSLEYLLADCLVQVQAPSPDEREAAGKLVEHLRAGSAGDPLVRGLAERWRLRQQLLGGEQSPD